MSQLRQTIYRDNLAKADEFPLIPEGNYNVIVSKTDYTTKDSGRESIDLTLKVLDGQYANRNLFLSVVMAMPEGKDAESEERRKTALNIGEKTLHQILSFSGISAITDTDELLNKMFSVKVVITPEKNGFPARNDVRKIMEYKGNVAPVASPRPQATAPVSEPQARPAANPWANVTPPAADKPARSW